MSKFEDSIPIGRFSAHFSQIREEVRATTVSEFLSKEPEKVPSICLFIWDEMVHRRFTSEPFKIAPIINNNFEGIYGFVARELKSEPITEAYAARFFNEHDDNTSFADVVLARCYPNDVHIVDVEFSDNSKPLPPGDPNRRYRTYRGLHVFDTFLERLKSVARAKDANRISLLVASPPVHQVFLRHGFRVNDTQMAQMAANNVGHGHAMVLDIA